MTVSYIAVRRVYFRFNACVFLYKLLGIFHEVPGDVKFLYLKARKLSMSPGIN